MIQKRTFFQNVLLSAAVAAVLLFCLFPFIQILSMSLKHQFDWGNPSLIPAKLNLEAYRELLGFKMKAEVQIPQTVKKLLDNPLLSAEQKEKIISKYQSTSDIFPFPRYFLNTFLLSTSAASVSLLLAVFGAYALSRLKFYGQHIIQRSILFVYMIGGVLLMVPLYQMSVKIGLARSIWGSWVSLLLIYIIQTLPVSLYMLGNYYRTIPHSLEEAAAMDGCSKTGVRSPIDLIGIEYFTFINAHARNGFRLLLYHRLERISFCFGLFKTISRLLYVALGDAVIVYVQKRHLG